MCNDCRRSSFAGIFTIIGLLILLIVPIVITLSWFSGQAGTDDQWTLSQMGMMEVQAAVGNPDVRTLNDAMGTKKPVSIAMEVKQALCGSEYLLYSNRHGKRSVRFVDDSTAWDFSSHRPEKRRRIVPLQAGITYSPHMTPGMQFGYTPGGGSESSESRPRKPVIRVIEGIPVSKRTEGDQIVYRIKMSQDLLD